MVLPSQLEKLFGLMKKRKDSLPIAEAKFDQSCSLIKTPVNVASVDGKKRYDNATALWDTGSEFCGISKRLAEHIGLKPIGTKLVSYGDGVLKNENVYSVCLTFCPSGRCVVVYAAEYGSNEEDLIIGMNVIMNGMFLIKPTKEGGMTFSFTV